MRFEHLPVTRYRQNCSVLWCEATRRAAVIDPGGNLDQVQTLLEVEDLELEVVLVTHGHMDHCGAAAVLAAAHDVRIEGPHRGDAHLIERLEANGARYGVRAKTFTPDRWLQHGDQVRFGRETLEVLHCPGHTRGHVAYYHAASRCAFVGDILFRGTIGAWEHPDGDLRELVGSIRERLFPLGDDVRFLPGHGAMSTFGRERAENPFVGDAAMARWAKRKTELRPSGDSAPATP